MLFSWFSLNFLFPFVLIYRSTVCAQTDSKLTSKIFVNRLCTNVRLTICAQMYQCTNSAQEPSSSDTSDSKRTSKIFVHRLTSVIFAVYRAMLEIWAKLLSLNPTGTIFSSIFRTYPISYQDICMDGKPCVFCINYDITYTNDLFYNALNVAFNSTVSCQAFVSKDILSMFIYRHFSATLWLNMWRKP